MTFEETPEHPLEDVAEQFLRRLRAGERPSVDEFAALHPQLADAIRELFPAMALLEGGAAPRIGRLNAIAAGDPAGLKVTQELGEYRLIREIGRGGMGVVYEAEQPALGRRVALKILSPELARDPILLQRFQTEATAAARLHHSNIVPVFGIGEREGFHFYAMQFIVGKTLKEQIEGGFPAENSNRIVPSQDERTLEMTHLADTPLFIRSGFKRSHSTQDQTRHEAARESSYYEFVAGVGMQVAGALAYAHENGVIHRDIKPSNLLLDLNGTVWIADFGLAKLHGGNHFTTPGGFVGTLRYLSPESLQGNSDARSDLFALGLTLYELLTGRPAYDAESRAALVRQVVEAAPPPPRKLARDIPRNLETIVLKLLEREPSRRYFSAGEAADDFRRFLEGQPVHARRAGMPERLWLWSRRNPVIATFVIIVLALMASLTGLSQRAAHRLQVENTNTQTQLKRAVTAERSLRDSVEALTQTQRQRTHALFDAKLAEARSLRRTIDAGHRLEALLAVESALAAARELDLPPERIADVRREAVAALAHTDLRLLHQSAPLPKTNNFVPVSPNHDFYAVCDSRGLITVYRIADGGEQAKMQAPWRGVNVSFSPDDRFLVSEKGEVVWDWRREAIIFRSPSPAGFCFSEDARKLVLAYRDGRVVVFDMETKATLHEFQTKLSGGIRVAISPDGQSVAVSSWNQRRVQIHDVSTGDTLKRLEHSAACGELAWHSEGRLLAVAANDFQIHLWNAETGGKLATLRGHSALPGWLAFTRKGDRLISSSWDRTVRVWDPWGATELVRLDGLNPRLSHDGSRLACQRNGGICVYEIVGGGEYRAVPLMANSAEGAKTLMGQQLSPNRQKFLASTGSEVLVIDLTAGGQTVTVNVPGVQGIAIDPREPTRLWTSSPNGLGQWSLESKVPSALSIPVLRREENRKWGEIATGGPLLAAADPQRGVVVFNTEEPERPPRVVKHLGGALVFVELSAEGRWLVSGLHHGWGVKLWDTFSDQSPQALWPDAFSARVRISPDGRWVGAATAEEFRVWDTQSQTLIRKMPSENKMRFAWSPDGSRLATAESNDRISLWNAESGRLMIELQIPDEHQIGWIEFGADRDQLLVLTSQPPHLRCFDLAEIRARLVELGFSAE